MDGYTQSEYHVFTSEDDEEEEDFLKQKVKYKILLKEDEFEED